MHLLAPHCWGAQWRTPAVAALQPRQHPLIQQLRGDRCPPCPHIRNNNSFWKIHHNIVPVRRAYIPHVSFLYRKRNGHPPYSDSLDCFPVPQGKRYRCTEKSHYSTPRGQILTSKQTTCGSQIFRYQGFCIFQKPSSMRACNYLIQVHLQLFQHL